MRQKAIDFNVIIILSPTSDNISKDTNLNGDRKNKPEAILDSFPTHRAYTNL